MYKQSSRRGVHLLKTRSTPGDNMENTEVAGLVAKIAATFATSTFFGAAIYANTVEKNARLSLPTTSAMVDHFQATFPRAMGMQKKLAAISSTGSAVGWYLDTSGDKDLLLYASLLMMFNLPWTKVMIMPINHQLMDGEYPKKKGDGWVKDMLKSWDRVHFVRSMASLSAMACLGTYWVKKSL